MYRVGVAMCFMELQILWINWIYVYHFELCSSAVVCCCYSSQWKVATIADWLDPPLWLCESGCHRFFSLSFYWRLTGYLLSKNEGCTPHLLHNYPNPTRQFSIFCEDEIVIWHSPNAISLIMGFGVIFIIIQVHWNWCGCKFRGAMSWLFSKMVELTKIL